jgi:hypothetical protein
VGRVRSPPKNELVKVWAAEMERRRRSRRRPSFGRRRIPDVAARVEVGRGCGSAGECKGRNCWASRCAFIGSGGGEGHDRVQWPLMAMAVAGDFKAFKRGKLDWSGNGRN